MTALSAELHARLVSITPLPNESACSLQIQRDHTCPYPIGHSDLGSLPESRWLPQGSYPKRMHVKQEDCCVAMPTKDLVFHVCDAIVEAEDFDQGLGLSQIFREDCVVCLHGDIDRWNVEQQEISRAVSVEL